MNIKKPVFLMILCSALLTSCHKNPDYQTDKSENKTENSKVSSASVTEVSICSDTGISLTSPVSETVRVPPSSYNIDNAEIIFQNPELPTGCEITSLAMLLKYLGFSVSKTELAEKYLEKDYTGKKGFREAFQGNPSWYSGFGCYSPVIRNAAEKYLREQKSEYTVKDISGTSFRDLYSYISEDVPVIVWASMDLIDVYKYLCFVSEKGEEQYWYDNEHCMLLTGYNNEDNTVTAADPLRGIVRYNAERFEAVYNELEKQAVIIEKK